MRRFLPRLATAILVMAVGTLPSWATVAVRMSHPDLVEQADLIVEGRCLAVESTWIDGDLDTLATIQVDEVLKGTSDPSITVVLPGGIDTRRKIPIAAVWAGQPRIGLGERVFLFLRDETSSLDGYTIVGFAQGKFSIVIGADGREDVTQDLGGLTLSDPDGLRRGGSTLSTRRELEDEVHTYLEDSNEGEATTSPASTPAP